MGLVGLRAAPALALLLALTTQPALAAKPETSAVTAATIATEDGRLARVFFLDERRETALDPLAALSGSEDVDPQKLGRLFTDALDRDQLQSARTALAQIARINRNRLSPERQISYDTFLRDKREEVAFFRPDIRALTAVRPLTHFGGLHEDLPTLVSKGGGLPFENEADYASALKIDEVIPTVFDRAIARFRQGMASGVVESRLTVGNMIDQIDAILAQPIESSPFYSPVVAFPPSVPEADRPALRSRYAEMVRLKLYPAYQRLRGFLADEYMPTAREAVGISAMPGGAGLYRRLIEQKTTLPLDPDAIHRLGLAEVGRIQGEMDKVKLELGYTRPLRTFFDVLRTDPRFHPASAQQLAAGYAEVARKVDAQLPRFFDRKPRAGLLIAPYPAYRNKFEAGGSYSQGSSDGETPGTFFFNTYDLPSRFITSMTTLYLHEGVPGHHFQICLAQENATLPDFQRFGGSNAFVEGWALYAETLGYEMGLYKDPMQHWGTLDDEMLRAMRLVVDTGIHAKGWNREQAIDYMLANSGMGRTDAETEVDRYIAIPAQALAYKIGALTIQRLRREAEQQLGPKFDIRTFHSQVLGSGAIPLPVLEGKIRRWIAARR